MAAASFFANGDGSRRAICLGIIASAMSDTTAKTKEFTVKNKLGMHARPASLFAKKAMQYKSEIVIAKDGNTSNAKSILGLLSLAVPQGSVLIVTANGEDAEEAIHALGQLIDNGFGEE